MRAEIVSIGTELMLGTITDTNASYLAQRLALLGIDCHYVSQVGDNLSRLTDTLRRASERSDLVITTGGLGPTQDDLTREAISAMLGEPMEVDPALAAELRRFFERRGVQMPEPNLKQATLISSSQAIRNPVGTAPGWWVEINAPSGVRTFISMPGVPYEMKRMWEHEVEPKLQAESKTVIVSRTLKILGLGESAAEEKVRDLMSGSHPTLAPYAKQDGVHLRMTAKVARRDDAQPLLAVLEDEIRSRLGNAVYGVDDETPHGVVQLLLRQLGYSCVLLEVGGPAAGALAPLLDEESVAASRLSLVSVPSLDSLAPLFGGTPDWTNPGTLRQAVSALKVQAGADVALGLLASAAASDAGAGVVVAEAEFVLLTPPESPESDDARAAGIRQTWRTERSEIRRLAGLVGINLLRLRLLKTMQQGSG